MYRPSESERKKCENILSDIIEMKNDYDKNHYVDEIFRIAYSIGGDYGESTLRTIAKALINKGNQ